MPAIESSVLLDAPRVNAPASATILLVDDHASARNSVQRVLDHAGYHVLPAPTGKRALKIFSDHSREIDLLITDALMPGMTGQELAARLQRQKPTLKVLLISGFTESATQLEEPFELIRKPFSGHVLIERIQAVLDYKKGHPC